MLTISLTLRPEEFGARREGARQLPLHQQSGLVHCPQVVTVMLEGQPDGCIETTPTPSGHPASVLGQSWVVLGGTENRV